MYKICFLVPYFNHPKEIKKLVGILKSYGIFIIIVDDGSDDMSKKALKSLDVKIITHKINQGKGAAVKTGMKWALQNGFTHIFQIDADMQHDLSIIPKMLQMSKDNKQALICGYGKYDQSAPKSRLYGRKITNFWVYVNTFGGKFKDAMTGIRIYPLNADIMDKTLSNAMEFDIEILMNYYKFNIQILWIEVGVVYGGVSHFRAFRDNILISKMQARVFFSLPAFICKRFKYGR